MQDSGGDRMIAPGRYRVDLAADAETIMESVEIEPDGTRRSAPGDR